MFAQICIAACIVSPFVILAACMVQMGRDGGGPVVDELGREVREGADMDLEDEFL